MDEKIKQRAEQALELRRSKNAFYKLKHPVKVSERKSPYKYVDRNWMEARSPVDYRKEVIPVEDIYNPKMEDKIVVIRCEIKMLVESDYNPDVIEVWGDVICTLYEKSEWQKKIVNQLGKYVGDFARRDAPNGDYAYLRGRVHYYSQYYDRYLRESHQNPVRGYRFNGIRPVYGMKFIVGDDEQYF